MASTLRAMTTPTCRYGVLLQPSLVSHTVVTIADESVVDLARRKASSETQDLAEFVIWARDIALGRRAVVTKERYDICICIC